MSAATTTIATTTNNNTESISNPFVSQSAEGDHATIGAQDMMKLLESLKLDTSDVELQELLQRAKKGEPIERDALMNIVSSLLSANSQDLGELTGSIGDFDIEFR